MVLLIKCLNVGSRKIICELDGAIFRFNKPIKGSAYVELPLDDGIHNLLLKKSSIYNTLVCYLNVINPIFFIWQLRFLEHRDIVIEKEFALIEMKFETRKKREESVVFAFSERKDRETARFLTCVRMNKLYNVLITNKKVDYKQVSRYKITNILSSIFHTVLLNILSVISYINNEHSLSVTLLFFTFTLFFHVIPFT